MPRKKIEPNKTQLTKLFELAPTRNEIAAWFEVSRQTVQVWAREDWFKTLEAGALDRRNLSLKRAQWKSALGGSVPMQIWLGKNMLGQRDQPEQNESAEELARQIVEQLKAMDKADRG